MPLVTSQKNGRPNAQFLKIRTLRRFLKKDNVCFGRFLDRIHRINRIHILSFQKNILFIL